MMCTNKVNASFLSRDEYDFLPVDGPLQNKNPVIIAGHKVALELWAVKVLYLYAHSRLVGCIVKEAGRKALGKYFSWSCAIVCLLGRNVSLNKDLSVVWYIIAHLVDWSLMHDFYTKLPTSLASLKQYKLGPNVIDMIKAIFWTISSSFLHWSVYGWTCCI